MSGVIEFVFRTRGLPVSLLVDWFEGGWDRLREFGGGYGCERREVGARRVRGGSVGVGSPARVRGGGWVRKEGTWREEGNGAEFGFGFDCKNLMG